jgi:hypothetical protein
MFFKRLWRSGLLVWLLLMPIFYTLSIKKHIPWGDSNNLFGMIRYDQEGYFMYLPATFVYGGFTGFKNNTRDIYNFLPYPNTNKIFTKYSCGVSVLQTPFYLGYLANRLYLQKNTEKSYITVNAVKACLWGVAFYTVLGLFFLYKTIRRFSDKFIAVFSVFAVYLGSCAYYYTIDMGLMAHIYSFTILSIILWFIPKIYAKPSARNTIIMGLLAGLLVLLRMTNLIALLFVLFWEVYSLEDVKARLAWIISHFKTLILIPIFAIIPFLPQMYWWYYWSGNWILYAYNQEGFTNWRSPEILNVLFSRKNGLFTYSPVLYGSVIGSILALKHRKISAPIGLLVAAISVYAFASWWQWFFGGCYGARSFVDFTPIFALPLAYLYQYLYTKPSKMLFYTAIFATLIAVLYAIRMTYLYEWTWMNDDTWTAQAYWNMVAKAFYIK